MTAVATPYPGAASTIFAQQQQQQLQQRASLASSSPANNVHPQGLPNGNAKASAISSRPKESASSVPVSQEPFSRVDTLGMKERLLKVLKADGDRYLKGLTGFLTGNISRAEWEDDCRKFLDTPYKRKSEL